METFLGVADIPQYVQMTYCVAAVGYPTIGALPLRPVVVLACEGDYARQCWRTYAKAPEHFSPEVGLGERSTGSCWSWFRGGPEVSILQESVQGDVYIGAGSVRVLGNVEGT